jgi:hypothetical protein
MSESVYIETSIFGHLTARTTTNPILIGNIQITREWWRYRRSSFEIYTSQAVINEVGRGDREMANQRLQLLQGIPLVELNQEIRKLAGQFLKHSNLPPKNCKHIANAQIQGKLAKISLEFGYVLSILCTPYELMGEDNDVIL